jgi:hypothetical protein
MNFSMVDSQIFPVSFSINSMHCAFRHRSFRSTEHRGLVHVNPHPKKMSGALELIIGVERTPELRCWLAEVIYPYTLPWPALAIVRKASSLPIFDKNLYTWHFCPIFEHESILQSCCLTPHKIEVVV